MPNLHSLSTGWPWKLFGGAWCGLAGCICWLATLPDPYRVHVMGMPAPQPYPYGLVGIELAVSAIVFAATAWALQGSVRQRAWRAALGGTLAGIVGGCAALSSMHMPACFVYFALAMLALAAFCIVLAMATVVILAVTRIRGR